MSEARAITNLIGNGVATVVIARWDGGLDSVRMNAVLSGEPVADSESDLQTEAIDPRAPDPAALRG